MHVLPTVTATNPATGTQNQPLTGVGTHIGRYRIMGPLGAGGMGTVYRGRRTDSGGNDVAIKVISNGSETHIRAIKREFRLMSEFRHPNFVKIYDLYAEGGVWYLVMELIEGRDIVSHVGALGDDCDQIEEAFCQLVQGVAALHRNRRLHRDLKPSNILVEASTGRVVILDFGLLQLADGEPLISGHAAGTPKYMAPEQLTARGPRAASEASDWYSVGVILSQVLTGRAPTNMGALQRRQELCDINDQRRALALLAVALLDPAPERRPTGRELLQRLQLQALEQLSDSPSLLGRETELSACWEAWRQIKEAGTVRLELAGEAGLGKTHLADRFLASLEHSDEALILRTRCFANERIPFRAIDALLEQLAGLHERFLDEQALTDQQQLAAFLSTQRNPETNALGQGADQRLRVIEALYRIICRLSTIRPVVIFIDDLQWGDRDSAQMLGPLLCQDNPNCRVLLIWALRTQGQRGSFLDEMKRLREQHHPSPPSPVGQLQLTALPTNESLHMASVLAGDGLAATTLQSIVEHAQGNPLFLRQAVLMARGRTWPRSGFSLHDALADQLRKLSTIESQVVALLAIASGPLKISVVLRVTGIELGSESMLIDLQHSGLVTMGPAMDSASTPGDDNLSLYHDSMRAPVCAGLSNGRRRQLHVELAQVLEQSQETPASTLALHFHAGGKLSSASTYAEQAGRSAAASLAYHAAIGHFQDALAWGNHSPSHRADLNEALGRSLFAVGHGARAAEALSSAQHDGPQAQSGARALWATTAWFSSGHLDQAYANARRPAQSTGLRFPHKRSLPLAIMWRLIKLRCSPGLRRLAASAATITPERTDDRAHERNQWAWALGTGASMFFPQQGIYFILESLLGSIESHDVHHGTRGLALLGGICANLGPGLGTWGQRCLDDALAIARARNDLKLLGWCGIWQANVELLRSNWGGALQYADRACELLEQEFRGSTWECNTARCFAMMALERQGRWHELGRRATESLAQSATRGDLYGRVMAMLFQAFRLLLEGRTDVARNLAEGAMQAWTLDGYTIQHFYALRVQCYCDLYDGLAEQARQRLDHEWPVIQSSDVLVVPSTKLDALLLRAHVGLGESTRALRGSLGPEGAAHADFVDAWRAQSHADSRRSGATFAALGMDLWANLAWLNAGDQSAMPKLQQSGVTDPARWLNVITAYAYR